MHLRTTADLISVLVITTNRLITGSSRWEKERSQIGQEMVNQPIQCYLFDAAKNP